MGKEKCVKKAFNKHRYAIICMVNCLCFIIVVLCVVNRLSWIYRANGDEAREEILGLHNIEGDIDVITFGSSNLLRHFIPLNAYRDYGITVFNYATSSGEMDMMRYYMEETLKYETPALCVVNVGCILYMSDQVSESGLRNWSDSLDIWNFTRLKSISQYLSSRDLSSLDIMAYYFDLSKYHNSGDTLGKREQYNLANGTYYNIDRGFSPYTNFHPFETPVVYDSVGMLTKQEYNVMTELLDYCDKEEINVLFMVNPYNITEQEWLKLNAIEKLINERGHDFVNFNRYYDEIGLEFGSDYADKGHMNYLGAEKFTDYFANYLKENYRLADHRGEGEYASWDNDAVTIEADLESWRTTTASNVYSAISSREKGRQLQTICEFDDWLATTKDSNFSLLIVKSEAVDFENNSFSFTTFATDVGMDLEQDNFAGIYSNGQQIYCANDENPKEGNIGISGGFSQSSYHIEAGTEPSIIVDGIEYVDSSEGIHVVVFDNNYMEVYDSVTLMPNAEGKIDILR